MAYRFINTPLEGALYTALMLITDLILVPLMGSITLIAIPMTVKTGKKVGLVFSLITFWLTVWVYHLYDPSITGYQLHVTNDLLGFAVDGVSLPFIILTGFITPIVILASWVNLTHNVKGFIAAQLLIEALLMLVWVVTDLVSFYVAFEAVLIPLFITVGLWGSSPTRIRSAFLLFMYTLSGSLMMLMSLMCLYLISGTGSFSLMTDLDLGNQYWVWIGIFLAFAVKTPIVPFHMWLPRAHADAPLAASMVLAGTVLKIASYGYMRFLLYMIPVMTHYYTPFVLLMAIVSLIYSSMATLRQWDMKALIAYSSVGHIAVVTLGLFSNSVVGIIGSIMLGLAHGVVSPAMFVVTGGVLYDRYHTRIITYYRGIAIHIPLLATIFFILTLCNIGVPLSLNWIGEFLCLLPLANLNYLVCGLALLSVVLSASYSIYLYVRICFGKYSSHMTSQSSDDIGDVNRREFWVLSYLIMPTVVFGFYTLPITNNISATVSLLVV